MLSLGEGIPFDTSVGEAVRDAQGNKVCIESTLEADMSHTLAWFTDIGNSYAFTRLQTFSPR